MADGWSDLERREFSRQFVEELVEERNLTPAVFLQRSRGVGGYYLLERRSVSRKETLHTSLHD